MTTGIQTLSEALRNKEISSYELTKEYLRNIKEKDGEINAYITITEEYALQKARWIDEKLAKGERLSPLAGIPMALKDNICTKGIRTTCASKILENFLPQEDATVTQKIDSAGAILLGKVNMDEFGMGSSNETSYFGRVHNPIDIERIPGGSSGGSAAAVAADLAVYSLGTDTGGSIRQPASYCGVVGMKPTYGAVSRYGVIPLAMSFDQVGPLAKDVTDTALILNEIVGYDERDRTSVKQDKKDYTRYLERPIKGMKIALPEEYFVDGLSKEVQETVMLAAKTLEKQGAILKTISTPHIKYAIPTYYMITCAEATAGLSVLEENRTEGFGKQVKKRILLGNYVKSYSGEYPYYEQALRLRTLIKAELNEVMNQFDCILAPTTPTTAFKLGGSLTPIEMYLSDIYTVSCNISGLPALSLPYRVDQNGLPIGVQLIGGYFQEEKLLQFGRSLERNKTN